MSRSSDYDVLVAVARLLKALTKKSMTRYQVATLLDCHPRTALRVLQRLADVGWVFRERQLTEEGATQYAAGVELRPVARRG